MELAFDGVGGRCDNDLDHDAPHGAIATEEIRNETDLDTRRLELE